MALGAAKAVADADRAKEIIIVGIDGENSAFEAVKDGKLAATFIYPFCAPEGIEYAYKVAKGEQVPERVLLKSTRVDASNVAQYLGKGFQESLEVDCDALVNNPVHHLSPQRVN